MIFAFFYLGTLTVTQKRTSSKARNSKSIFVFRCPQPKIDKDFLSLRAVPFLGTRQGAEVNVFCYKLLT